MAISRVFTVILGLVFATSALAVECPLGKGETELSFTRVMLNFGKYTRNADFVSVIGQENPSAVDEAKLDAAIAELPVAKACAAAVANDATNTILPASALDMDAKDLQTYADKIKARMNEFIAMLDVYLAELESQKSKTEADRDFTKAYESSQNIKGWVGEVHEELKTRSKRDAGLSDRNGFQRTVAFFNGEMFSVAFYKNDFNPDRTRIYKFCWAVSPMGAADTIAVSYCTNNEPVKFHLPRVLELSMSQLKGE